MRSFTQGFNFHLSKFEITKITAMENGRVLDRVVINLIKDIIKVGDVVIIDNIIGEVEFVGKIGVMIKRGEESINLEIKKIKSIEV